MACQPKTGAPCTCKPGVLRDNCGQCEGTGMRINFAAIRARLDYQAGHGPLSSSGAYLDAYHDEHERNPRPSLKGKTP